MPLAGGRGVGGGGELCAFNDSGGTFFTVTFGMDSLHIRLEKDSDLHWDMLGSYLPGHGSVTAKAKRG